MYLIKRIIIDDTHRYIESMTIDHTSKGIASALKLLESSVRNYVRDTCGKEAYDSASIIDIHTMDQVNEPIVDGVLLYRLESDPHKIHVYQRKTIVAKSTNWRWAETVVATSQFNKVCIYELEEYQNIPLTTTSSEVDLQMITVGKVKIPLPMTISPMLDLIKELKECERFKAKFTKTQLII